MSKTAKVDLARATKEELLDYLESARITVSADLPLPQLRERAMEVQQTLSASKEDDDLERRAKAASAKILGESEESESEDSDDDDIMASLTGGVKSNEKKKFSMDSLEVFPEDGMAGSINEIISDSATGRDDMETVEERILREHKEKQNDLRMARFVAGADAEINEYHRNATQKHNANLTNICFFLKTGTFLSTFTTPYTKISGVRLRRETPYRALDLELKFFRSKRKMFGEVAYDGPNQVAMPKAAKAKNK